MVALTTAAFGYDVLDLHYWMVQQIIYTKYIYTYMCEMMYALYSLYTRSTRSTRGCPMASTGLRMLSDSSSTSFSHTSASPGTSSCLAGWVKTTVSKRVLILRTWSLIKTFLAFWVLNGSLFIFQGPYFHFFGFIHAKNVNSVCMYTTMVPV